MVPRMVLALGSSTGSTACRAMPAAIPIAAQPARAVALPSPSCRPEPRSVPLGLSFLAPFWDSHVCAT